MEAPKLNFQRKLATILTADVVGYSKLMAKGEENTLEVFIGHKRVFESLVYSYNGRVFNTAGDAILAEFPSVIDAVKCAIEIQQAMQKENSVLDESKAVVFRIGIHLGDVVVQGTDLLGDGVNVAARVQTAARPGGICISGIVFEQIQGKLKVPTLFMGDRIYKNIPKPVPTYSINLPGLGVQFHNPTGGRPAVSTVQSAEKPFRLGFGTIFFFLVLGFAGLIGAYRENGYALKTAVCSEISEGVPPESVNSSLQISQSTAKLVRQGFHCTFDMTCYLPGRPWESIKFHSRQVPFQKAQIYLDPDEKLSAFVDPESKRITFRAFSQPDRAAPMVSSIQCVSDFQHGTIYPMLYKIFQIGKNGRVL